MTSPALSSLPEAILEWSHCRSIEPGRRLRIGVLHNPLSGRNRRSGLDDVHHALRAFPDVRQCEVRSPPDIFSALSAFSREGIELIVVNGGVGTIQATLTVLLTDHGTQGLPLLAVLPTGTTNMIAGDVGLRGTRPRALQQLCAYIPSATHGLPLLRRHVLRVQSDVHPESLCGMFFGTGGILQGIEYCRRSVASKGIRGEIGPAVALARFLFALVRGQNDVLQPIPLSVGVNGGPLESSECLALFVSTLDRLFLGLRPYWGREVAPLHYTMIRANPRHLLRVVFALLRGRPHPMATWEHGYHSANVAQVQLAVPHGFTLDGELFVGKGSTVTISDAGQVSFIQF